MSRFNGNKSGDGKDFTEEITDLTAQLAQTSKQEDLNIEKSRIDNIVANVGNASGNTEIIDMRVGQDGKTYASAGLSIRSQLKALQTGVSNPNGYDLTRKMPMTDDITTSRVDGVFYSNAQDFNSPPVNLNTTYTGIVRNIAEGRRYRITVYVIGDYTLNYLNFYDSRGVLIVRDATNYGYTVIDEANRIIEVTAPLSAVIMTYTDYLTNKNKGYCKAFLSKLNIDWLEIGSVNLDKNVKRTFESIGDAYALTTKGKTSGNIVHLYEDGYYMATSWYQIAKADFGTSYFKATGGDKYRMRVFSVDAVAGSNSVIYFWDAKNLRIDPTTYVFTVVDRANMIIEIIAPINAVLGTITYTGVSGGKEAYFVNRIGGNHSFDWLTVNKENLSGEIKDRVFNDSVKLKYKHCLDKPFNFTGKSITFFGDSITAGSTSPSLAVTPSPYCKIFADKFSMVSVNRAVGGTTICDTENPNSILNRVLTYTTQRDFLWIAGGTNDWTLGKPVGNYGDTTGETFYGALRVMCEHLKTNHASSTIIFVTPINQNVIRALSVTTLDAYRNAIFEIATSYGFNVVDGKDIGFPSEGGGFANAVCSDGVHPSLLGHSFYAKSLLGILV